MDTSEALTTARWNDLMCQSQWTWV